MLKHFVTCQWATEVRSIKNWPYIRAFSFWICGMTVALFEKFIAGGFIEHTKPQVRE
jgi:hypothetical protein